MTIFEFLFVVFCFFVSKSKINSYRMISYDIVLAIEYSYWKIYFNIYGAAGAKSVDVDLKQQKATVTGYVEAKKVLEAAKSTKKKVEMWPYVPYTLVANPYVAQAYDKKAPPNMVRGVPNTATVTETTVDDRYTMMFSDENPNACSIM